MPNILVGLSSLNNQGIEGLASILDSALELRDSNHEGELKIFPVVSRVEDGEQEKLDAARSRAREVFSRFLPKSLVSEPRDYWDDMEVPYKKFYAYEEILATFRIDSAKKRSFFQQNLPRFNENIRCSSQTKEKSLAPTAHQRS